MASFAKKYQTVGKQEGAVAAARALGIKNVNKGGEVKKVQAYLAGQASNKASAPASAPPASAPAGGGGAGGVGSYTDLGNKFPNNEVINSAIAGKNLDYASTMANIGLAELYTKSQLGALSGYQKNIEDLKVGNSEKLLATEGAIAEDLVLLKDQDIPLKLRADARGQIASQGARFFG